MQLSYGESSLPAELAGRLRGSGLDPAYVAWLSRAALAEDLSEDGVYRGGRSVAGADLTTEATIPAAAVGSGDLVAHADGVVAGLAVAEAVFWLAVSGGPAVPRHAGSACRGEDGVPPDGGAAAAPGEAAAPFGISYRAADGERVRRGDVLLTVTGPVRALLTAERTALNLLCHLSGVATLTRRWVDEIEGTGARIRDTRKTLPGLRALQKYAVRCGGGENHRMSLSDAVLIKDNHVAAAGSISAALAEVNTAEPLLADAGTRVTTEVECDTLGQVHEAAGAGARLILLDNFSIADMAAAVAAVAGLRPRPRLEASGGLTLERARDVAAAGVDYLSVGALTHSAPALDIGLDLTLADLERHAAGD